jgi:hypothetical protein
MWYWIPLLSCSTFCVCFFSFLTKPKYRTKYEYYKELHELKERLQEAELKIRKINIKRERFGM